MREYMAGLVYLPTSLVAWDEVVFVCVCVTNTTNCYLCVCLCV